MEKKPVEQLTAKQALAELKTLSEDVEFDETFDENTPIERLQALVTEGRDVLAKSKEPVPPKVTSRAKATPKDEEVDYLRKYQWRKGAKPGSKQSDPQPGSKAEKIKKLLLTQRRITVLIPKPESEKGDFPHSVTINGYRLDLPKNEYLDLPEQVAELIKDSHKQVKAAFDRMERNFGVNRMKEGVRVGDAISG